MLRARLLAVVGVTLTGLLVPSTPTPAAHAAPVRAPDVLTPAEIVRVFPAFKEVGISRFPERRFPAMTEQCATGPEVVGTSGRLVTGYGSDRTVTSLLVKFATKAQAKAVFAGFQRYVGGCRQYWAGVDTALRPVKVPRLGDQRLGFRLTATFRPELHQRTIYTRAVLVRDGKRLLLLSVDLRKKVRAAPFARLARVAVRKMG
ncbi:hypothetical protein [Pimelobacter simplex]|uniref:hypothetical protein n=1 Tax=Nocardioides simplex TaxID=2045 RepID=UPI003AAD1BCE